MSIINDALLPALIPALTGDRWLLAYALTFLAVCCASLAVLTVYFAAVDRYAATHNQRYAGQQPHEQEKS